jgi:CO dehydrogenase nickel-insertion accessory protein CooC1
MNEQSKSLLVVKTDSPLSDQVAHEIKQTLEPLAQELGARVLVVDGGTDATLHQNLGPLVEMMGKQVAALNRLAASNESLVRAMAEAENDDQGDVQPLPARGLNGRPL